MRTEKRLLLAILAVIAALALGTASATAKATKTQVSGHYELLPGDLPAMTFPDGNAHIRGWETVSKVWFNPDADPIAKAVSVFDCNLDSTGTGSCSCDYRLELGTWDGDKFTKGDGVWEGHCTGKFFDFFGEGGLSLRFVAQGSEALEGTKYVFTIAEIPIWTGYVLDPHGRYVP
jgi:hypothetical protein